MNGFEGLLAEEHNLNSPSGNPVLHGILHHHSRDDHKFVAGHPAPSFLYSSIKTRDRHCSLDRGRSAFCHVPANDERPPPYLLANCLHCTAEKDMASAPNLFTAARDLNWEELSELCRTSPEDAQFKAANGYVALHMACVRGCPSVNAINDLIHAYPDALNCRDKSGNIPLHYASVYCSVEVLVAILASNPEAANQTNKRNQTPLDYFCWLSDAFPGVKIKLGEILHSHDDNLEQILGQPGNVLFEYWTKVSLLVKAMYHLTMGQYLLPEEGTWRMLHACCGVCHCPAIVFKLALKVFPDQLCECDEEGNLPLHIACSAVASSGTTKSGVYGNAYRLKCVLESFPAAAKHRNALGKLPLFCALEHQKSWNESTHCIFRAFRGVAVETDDDLRLYPFMLAAVGDRSCLNSTYEVLRSNPELERFVGCQQ